MTHKPDRSRPWSERCVARIFSPLVTFFERQGEPPDERRRKWLLIPVAAITLIGYFPYMLADLASQRYANFAVRLAICSIASFNLVHCYLTRTMPLWLSELIITMQGTLACLVIDLQTYGLVEAWCMIVIVMDCLLLCGCRDIISSNVRNGVVAFLVVKTVEEAYRFGLYAAVPTNYDNEDPESVGWQVGLSRIIFRLASFLIDFSMTRWFATSMRLEQDRILASVALAECIASALVKFDLERAEKLTTQAQENGVSVELIGAFQGLLSNLKLYRAYLPEALLAGNDTESPTDEMLHPSSFEADYPLHEAPVTGEVAVVFTDIQGSTALWEASQTDMKEALIVHNDVMRRAISRNTGYEVKVIGDAFMVAFASVDDACNFCLEAQMNLVEKEWSGGLLKHPDCAVHHDPATGTTIWRGLRVRMGVHVGPCDVMQNPVTHRFDYFGQTVNLAARIESAGVGGAVCISDVARKKMTRGVEKACVEVRVEPVQLKGISSRVTVHLLLPTPFEGRKAHILSSWKRKHGAGESTDTSSLSGGSHQPRVSHDAVVPIALRPKMKAAVATIAYIRADFSYIAMRGDLYTAVNEIFATTVEHAVNTQGTALAASGNGVLVAWNVGKLCDEHESQALRFAGAMHGSPECGEGTKRVTIGMASSPIIYGTVGAERARFLVAIGEAIVLSSALAEAALDAQTYTLLGSSHSTLRNRVVSAKCRLLDKWQWGAGPVAYVFEVNTKDLAEMTSAWDLLDESLVGSWGSSRLHDLTLKALAGNKEALHLLTATTDSSDKVMVRCLQRLSAGGHLWHSPFIPSVDVPSANLSAPQGHPHRSPATPHLLHPFPRHGQAPPERNPLLHTASSDTLPGYAPSDGGSSGDASTNAAGGTPPPFTCFP